MVTIMRRQVDHLVRLVDDLLEVSRISRGAIALEKEVLLLGEVMQDAIEISRPLLERKDQKLTMQMPTAAPAVLGDRVRLVQVISNVLNNASKFTPVGGRIAVLLSAEGESAVLRVIDNGVGIDPQHLESIFEMFHQVGHGAHSTGMGVGLSLARRLVQMHGGSVRALSAGAGQGTEIRIQIPLQRLASVTTDDSPESPQPPQATTRRLLVVDDNRDAAEVLSAFLNALGHETHVAHDGPAALATAERVRPDVVLLDIGMPGMSGYEVALMLVAGYQPTMAILDLGMPSIDGFELARRLRALRGDDIRLIALTGWGQASDRTRSKDAGFDEHLMKPVDVASLEALLYVPFETPAIA
jgi:CheY-like chemotaxis protein